MLNEPAKSTSRESEADQTRRLVEQETDGEARSLAMSWRISWECRHDETKTPTSCLPNSYLTEKLLVI